MELDPRQVPIVLAIGTGICVGVVGYLTYVLISILATAWRANANPPHASGAPPRSVDPDQSGRAPAM